MATRQVKGFTLIEVLIALAILAIALLAVVKATQSSIQDTLKVKSKVAAHWVAYNVLAELQVGLLPPRVDGQWSGSMNMMKSTWYWRAQRQGKSGGGYYRVNIAVNNSQAETIDSVTGFVYQGVPGA